MNLWRDMPTGKAPDPINVVIEVKSGSGDKYEYRADWETFVQDRVLHSSIVFLVVISTLTPRFHQQDVSRRLDKRKAG